MVKFDHSLSRTLFCTQQKCDIHFQVLRVKILIPNFAHSNSSSRTLLRTQQKCDIYIAHFLGLGPVYMEVGTPGR